MDCIVFFNFIKGVRGVRGLIKKFSTQVSRGFFTFTHYQYDLVVAFIAGCWTQMFDILVFGIFDTSPSLITCTLNFTQLIPLAVYVSALLCFASIPYYRLEWDSEMCSLSGSWWWYIFLASKFNTTELLLPNCWLFMPLSVRNTEMRGVCERGSCVRVYEYVYAWQKQT